MHFNKVPLTELVNSLYYCLYNLFCYLEAHKLYLESGTVALLFFNKEQVYWYYSMKYEDDFNSERAWQECMIFQYCVFMRFCPTVLLFPVMNMSWLLPPTRDQRAVKFPARTMPLGNQNNNRGCPKFRLLSQIMFTDLDVGSILTLILNKYCEKLQTTFI
jgi:hypothetical protein